MALTVQQPDVKARFKRGRLRALVSLALFCATLGAYAAGANELDSTWFGYPIQIWAAPFALAFIATPIGFILSWRCPQCGGHFGKRLFPKFCSSCGVELL